MHKDDLHFWRRAQKMTQADLAKAMGVSRNTIINWELGVTRLPKDIDTRLLRLERNAIESNAKPMLVTPETAKERGDLKLYVYWKRGSHPWTKGDEHPHRLLPHTDRATHNQPSPPAEWSILESAEYLEALARHRAQPAKPKLSDIMMASITRT